VAEPPDDEAGCLIVSPPLPSTENAVGPRPNEFNACDTENPGWKRSRLPPPAEGAVLPLLPYDVCGCSRRRAVRHANARECR
jgi:hypothetical protein